MFLLLIYTISDITCVCTCFLSNPDQFCQRRKLGSCCELFVLVLRDCHSCCLVLIFIIANATSVVAVVIVIIVVATTSVATTM